MFLWGLFVVTLGALIVVGASYDRLKQEHQQTISCHQKEIDEFNEKLEEAKEDKLKIINEVVIKLVKQVQQKGIYTNYKAKTLCDKIMRNLDEIGIAFIDEYDALIIHAERINFDDFEKTIKTVLYADKGYLTIHEPDDKPMYRIGKNGKHLPIEIEEYQKMINKEYDFIFDSITL